MFTVARWKQSLFWGVFDATGTLVCLCVYKRGANAIIARLEGVSP